MGISGDVGPDVLLLHGFGTSAARTWRDNGWIDLLEDMGRTVRALDLPGHGPAPQPRDPSHYADMPGLVAAGLPPEPVDAVGFSLGSRMLLEMAIADSGRFRRLVVSGVGANLFRRDPSGLIVQALRGEADPSDPVAHYFASLADAPQADREALIAVMERPHAALTAEQLAAVTCPTLVVLGENDFAGPADPLVEALPDARLVTLPRTDHFATPKDFRFIDATLDFLGA